MKLFHYDDLPGKKKNKISKYATVRYLVPPEISATLEIKIVPETLLQLL